MNKLKLFVVVGCLNLAGCAALDAFLRASAPVAGQMAASSLAAAVASARAAGQLPSDPTVDQIQARLAALEAADRAETHAACVCSVQDAGAPPALDARAVVELLDREAAARAAAAAERSAIAEALRGALVAARAASAPSALPAPAGRDAGAGGGADR